MPRTQYTLTCPICEQPYPTINPRQKTCSKVCAGFSRTYPSIPTRFQAKTAPPETPDGCALWTAGTFNCGYGLFKMKCDDGVFRARYAHRVAYELAHNCCILPGFEVLHKCDTPLCVRPDHLRLGTTLDNRADCVAKERQARGERSGRAKVTESDVLAIRQRYADGERIAHLAREYGLAYSAMASLAKHETWKHVA